ncbi:MAG: GNAT family N-acetyltransferase [Phycisphaerae bacterium]
MRIRTLTPADVEQLLDIDATLESDRYLHVDVDAESLTGVFRFEERPLRQPLHAANAPDDAFKFSCRQVVGGIEEGIALAADHNDVLLGTLLARTDFDHNTLRLLDLRVDYDHRRQGLASALLFELVRQARETERRAVMAEVLSNNLPAVAFLFKAGFELSGIDTRRHSNHDLVKEQATLLWYLPLD